MDPMEPSTPRPAKSISAGCWKAAPFRMSGSSLAQRLRASVVLPMHRFATPLDEFMHLIGRQFEIDRRSERSFRMSRDALPTTPTVIILDGV